MKQFTAALLIFGIASAGFAGCKKEKASAEDNDNELITTIQLSITRADSAHADVYSWKDIDGAGGEDPQIDSIKLAPNTAYRVQIGILDESQAQPVGITTEIRDESDVHRFYFESSPGLGITVSEPDLDSDNLPLGLNSTWTTKATTTGTLRIVLRHYPNGGKEAGDEINSSKSNTDAEVTFPVSIQLP